MVNYENKPIKWWTKLRLWFVKSTVVNEDGYIYSCKEYKGILYCMGRKRVGIMCIGNIPKKGRANPPLQNKEMKYGKDNI